MGSEEEEEEEFLVHVEFDSILDSETFKNENLFFKVIGIDSEKPIMQIGDQVFTGEYRDIPGTSLFFEEDNTECTDDAVFAKTAERSLSYKYKTRKALVMRRVFIKKKDPLSVQCPCKCACPQDESKIECDEQDMNVHLTLKPHSMSSEGIFGTELGMEIAGVKLNEEMSYPSKEMHSTLKKSKQSKLKRDKIATPPPDKIENPPPDKIANPPPDKIAKIVKCNIEPVAGPSWAPDVSPVDCDEMFEEMSTSSVNADEMSRLIVEQMTLESDIKMHNSASPSQSQD